MRFLIFTLIALVLGTFIFLLLAVNDDKKWFNEFSKSTTSKSAGNQTDESQILNLALSEAVDSSNNKLRRRLPEIPPPPRDPFTKKADSNFYRRAMSWRDSVQKILDTGTLYLVVYKENVYTPYADRIKEQIDAHKGDTSFNQVLRIFCSQNLSRDSIDISVLKPDHNYKVVAEDMNPFDIRRIGSLHFSKIPFNRSKDTACIFTEFSCGEFCGKGDILFLIKNKSLWSVVKTQNLWK